MLPEKLPVNKYLFELEPTGDGTDDLTGDAGAVGRMLVSGAAASAHQHALPTSVPAMHLYMKQTALYFVRLLKGRHACPHQQW